MTNVIFGSGIVALLAKRFLPGEWEVVPFGRSRFYSFNPPLADNFIVRDAEVDLLMSELGYKISSYFYRYAYSVNGQLLTAFDSQCVASWLSKALHGDAPLQASVYWQNRLVSSIYDVRITTLYRQLLSKSLPELRANAAKGEVTSVGDHYFVRGGVRTDFDNCLSTVPLSLLYRLIGLDSSKLKSISEYYYHVASAAIDLEGVNQALVVDNNIDFYRCSNIKPGEYLFYSTRDIIQPGSYFLQIIGNGDLLDGTTIRDAVPVGPIPDLDFLDAYGIFCIGSTAQHDWCMDVGSCLKRLVRYIARGFTVAKPKVF